MMGGDSNSFYAAGKLLLFGEYLVLRGAKALSVPLKKGQHLTVEFNEKESGILWISKELGKEWLNIRFSRNLEILETNSENEAQIVQNILKIIQNENPNCIKGGLELKFNTDFKRKFGWGTSSTLVSLLSQWSGMDGQFLLKRTFDGSGYDVATATEKTPIIYQKEPFSVQKTEIDKNIADKLLFVYTGQKQSTEKEVRRFKDLKTSKEQIETMNLIIEKAAKSTSIEQFETLVNESETLLSTILQRKKIKDMFFNDYPFAVKSLGAWGGDFAMVSFRDAEKAKRYFKRKGFKTMFYYDEIVKK